MGWILVAVLAAVLAVPWAVAVRLLWRAWRAGATDTRSDMDGPGWLLAAAVATLPGPRRDWGLAMTAELAQVPGRSSRWRFAAGCALVSLFPPRSSRVPLLVVGVGAAAAVVAAGMAVGAALPAMRVFAVTFVALVGAAATLVVARSRRVRPPGVAVTAVALAGVAGCIAIAAWFVSRHPTAGNDPGPVLVVFAVVLAGCVWLALVPPPGLASSRLARRVGVGTAVALGLGFVLVSRLALERENGVSDFLLVGPVVVFFAGSAVAAAAGRSFRAGVQAAVWTALAGTLLVFVLGVPEALLWYRVDGRLLLDGERGYSFGENLAGAIWMLVWIPAWGLPFGVIGAAVGNGQRLRARARGQRRGSGRAATIGVAAGLLLIAVGAMLASMHRIPDGEVIPNVNVDHAAIGYLLILVALVATPILLLLRDRHASR